MSVLLLSLAVLLWPWLGYPALLALYAWARPRRLHALPMPAPPLSVIIAARDEADHIGAKLDSLAAGGAPHEAIVVDDGSLDATSTVAAAHGARVIRLPRPAGKAVALATGVEAALHPIVVLTDARQPLAPGALAALALPLADPRVGAVTGELDGGAGGAGALFRRFENLLRRLEARTGSSIGVTGALWACRRALFPRLPRGLILDDVYAPLAIVRAGRRVVVAKDARAIDLPEAGAPDAERRRRVRTLAGNLQLLRHAPGALLSARFLSHKLLRLGGPFALAAAAAALATLAPAHPLWAATALLPLALAALGRRAGVPGLLARGFLEAQTLCLAAFWVLARGEAEALWRPTVTPIPPAPGPALASTPASAGSLTQQEVHDGRN